MAGAAETGRIELSSKGRRWRRLRRSVALFLVPLATAWIGINVYGDWYIARNQTSHEPEASPASAALSFQDVQYAPGRAAWLIPAEGNRPVIVVVHGSGSNRSGPLDVAKGLHGRGYPLLLISLRYDHGHRPFGGGQRESQDIRAAMTYAATHLNRPVVLLGYSLGGFEVSAAAAGGARPAAVISDSGFVSFESNASDHGHLPRPVFSLFPILYPLFSDGGHLIDIGHEVGKSYAVPTLVIQGTSDTMVATHQGTDLARLLHAELWLLPNVGHTDGYRVMPTAYLDRLDAFITSALRTAR